MRWIRHRETGHHGGDRFSVSHLKDNLRRRAAAGGATVLVTQLLSILLNFGSIAILSRLLTPAEFGVAALVLPFFYLLTEVAQGALGQVTVQRDEISHVQASGLFWANALIGLGLALLTMGLGPLVVLLYDDSRLYPIMFALAGSVLVSGLGSQFLAILVRQMRFGSLRTTQLSADLLAVVAALLAALAGLSYWAIVVQMVCRQLFRLVFCAIATGWLPDGIRSIGAARGMLGFGGYLGGFSVLTQLGHGLGTVMVGRAFGEIDAGLFNRAWSLSSLPVSQLMGPLANVMVPVLSRAASDTERLGRVFSRIFSNVALHSAPIAAVTFVGADQIVSILLGPDWSEAADYLRAFSILMLSMPIASTINWICIASGRTDALFQHSLVALPLIVLGILLSLPYGPIAVAYTHAVAGIALRLPALILISRRCDIPLPLKTVSAGIIVAIIVFATELYLASTLTATMPSLNRWFDLAALCSVVGVLHSGATLVYQPTRSEAFRLFRAGLKALPLAGNARS